MDTNFNDTSSMEANYSATPVKKVDVEKELSEYKIDKDSWGHTQKLIKMSIDRGLEQALEQGYYDSSIVKDAQSLMRLANKSFDDESAQKVMDRLEAFKALDKRSLDNHKLEASNAAAVN